MKRYDSYKDSGVEWIGEVPNHWNCARLKFYSEPLKSGGTPKSDNDKFYSEDGTPWVAISDMSSTNYILDTEKHLTQEGIDDKRLIVYPIGTILYSIYATLGKVSELGVPACINQAILAIVPKSNYNREYFKYCLQAQEQYVFSLSNGNTQNNLNAGKVANFMLTLPPLSEQQAIASYLDKRCGEIDKAIAKQQKRIELLQELRQSIITNAVTRGINPDAPLKDSGVEWIGEVPNHWEVRRIKSLSIVKRGASPRPIDDPKYFDENGTYAWVRIADVTDSERYLTKTTQSLSFLGSSFSVKREPGDFFISIAGSVGKPIITQIKCCIHDGFVWFPNLHLNAEYLYYIFKSGQPYLGLGKLGTQLNLNTETIGNICIPLPPEREISDIINYLDKRCGEIDRAIAKQQKRIELLQELKQSIITEVVTGKRKVC